MNETGKKNQTSNNMMATIEVGSDYSDTADLVQSDGSAGTNSNAVEDNIESTTESTTENTTEGNAEEEEEGDDDDEYEDEGYDSGYDDHMDGFTYDHTIPPEAYIL